MADRTEGAEAALRDVSDTAFLVGIHRARESERRDRLFSDPYARALAGERGDRIAREMAWGLVGWPVVARTVFFDQTVSRLANSHEIGCVLNLAAGLDTRPYRLGLPPDLLWVEADLPGVLDYKAERLARESPRCRLQRVTGDLSEAGARGRALDATTGRPTLVLTEGLLVYLVEEDVIALTRALASRANLRYWLLDISGPQAVRWSRRGRIGQQLARADARHRFAPPEGPEFLRPYGWAPLEVHSSWDEARRLGRLPGLLRLVDAVTPPARREAYRNLARVALLERQATPHTSAPG